MRYRNLAIWKRSRGLSISVYKYSLKIRDFGFKDQLTRSALSVPSNIAEGFEKNYTKEKTRFLSISKGSLGEFATQVDIGVEVGFIEKSIGNKWMQEAEELSKMIGKLIQIIKS
ncbi:four helix bundle protein [Aliikangiella sp. IMCC44359]|uniref:four helix bundle protein n=1 Tax=Aliikangiella sp. IMCC44359 TaxID=3459125 RepID=UPI00403B2644